MGSQVNLTASLIIFAIYFLAMTSSTSTDDKLQFLSSLENFSGNIFSKFLESYGDHNLIYSPFSIQTCLAMTRMAANGQTAVEMDEALSFTGQPINRIADSYHQLLSKYENSDILKIANKVYVKQGFEIQDQYKQILTEKFFSSAENIDFGHRESAANTINTWVEKKTNNVIKDLIKPQTLSHNTRLFLLSAIYFKGSWETSFDEKRTVEQDFYLNETHTVKVPMMNRREFEDFAILPELEAKALRLPYRNSDLSMLIILPNSRNGLAALLEKLRNVKLPTLTQQNFHNARLLLKLPKFKAELDITLNDILKKMGMQKMFTDGDFSQMLKSPEPLVVDSVLHKAFIEVNEEGTVAAAVTGLRPVPTSAPMTFYADHPFYYVIINEDSVPLFQGTFVGL